MSFQLVRKLQQKAVLVDRICRVLEVSRSGYCAACESSRTQPVVCEASVQLKAAFAASGGASAQAGAGGRHQLHPNAQRLAVSGRCAGPVCAQSGGLGDGPGHAVHAGMQGAATGYRAAPAAAPYIRRCLPNTAWSAV